MIASILGLLIISKTERFDRWLEKFILSPSLSDQMEHMGVEERREYRFGNLYALCQYAKKTLDTAHTKNKENVILLPPNEYLRSINSGFNFPEPIAFYYHTGGIKSVWTTSPNVEDANWTFLPRGQGSIVLVPISKEELHKLLITYKKYNPI